MYLILTASPNTDGLTAACAEAAHTGLSEASVEAHRIHLCKLKLEHCRQCGNGWGQCLREHTCVIQDDIVPVQEALAEAEGIVLVTPVYYGEPSEAFKAVFDRVRRCETGTGEEGRVVGKPIISVAAAGGSGGGITTCLLSMEMLTRHLRAQVADLIGVTQHNRAYTLGHIQAAARNLVTRVPTA
ncbi:MAG: FMN-dependent NADH-azoreductase [bacterium ADurb.Bin429]|nr:MAG: FMN-dependent NADH-azoreductase [bacterium ADurb.Bin429]